MIYPITFSFPSEKIINEIPKKNKILSNLIPGNKTTYSYNNEDEYYDEYKQSYFAITMKKSGWDCMRHYEIICNGCIPYFYDIEKCPKNTLSLLPKDLLLQGNELFHVLFNNNNQITNEFINDYNKLLNKLIDYTRKNLTTEAVSKYILKQVNFNYEDTENIKILFLSGDTSPDYLRCLTLHGFKKIFKKNCQEYPKINHIYKSNNIDYKSLYGKGFTYSNLLDSEEYYHLHEKEEIINKIIKKEYQLIIYGSYHRGMPFFDLIRRIYSKDKIILLCGEDEHLCEHKYYTDNGYNVFIRELL